ncbi:MAG: tetratricopeptide repeat protein [Anaerolineae bacterium]|nr:tetratricopeptide repeat protein [Anaerolineae bacterium]
MPAIPSVLTQRLHETLVRCPDLESDRALRAVFVDTRLAPWINRVPENAPDRATRVNLLIAALCDQTAANGDNALILLLYVLSETVPSGDALRDELAYLAVELQTCPPTVLASLAPPIAGASPGVQIEQQIGQQVNIGHLVLNVGQPAPQSATVPFQTLNPPDPFIDRATIREWLNEQLRAGGAHLLCGIGGVGKTALALRVAQDLIDARAFPDGVLWIPLEGAPTADMAAAWILAAFDRHGEPDPLGALTGFLRTRRPLLVLDNAESAKDTAAALLARRGQATVLVTSRDVTVGLQSIPDVPTDLTSLEPDDAVALLRARLGDIPAPDQEAAAIADLVGNLPLALTLAAAFITRRLRRERDPLAAYLDRLRRHGLAALEFGERRDASVRVTFDLSWQALTPAARDALGALALIPGDTADMVALQSVLQTDTLTLESLLWQLSDVSLLIQTGERYSLHPLLRHYTVRQLPAEQAAACRARLFSYYFAYAQAHTVTAGQSSYAPLEVERDNILGVMAWAWEREDWPAVIALAEAVHDYLQLRGYPQAWRERAAWRLHAARQLHDTGEIANALLRLSEVHRQLSEYKEAQARLEEALRFYRANGDRLGEANVLKSLGDVHLALSAYREARVCYENALPLYRALDERLGEANGLRSLGDVHVHLFEYEDARACYEAALPLYRAIDDRLGEANVLSSLGDMHAGLDEYTEARARYDAALSLYRAIGARLSEANVLLSLGDAHYMLDACEEARTCYEDARPLYEATGDRLGEANVLRSLGNMHFSLGEYEAARGCYEGALSLCQAIDDRVGEANTLGRLGNLHFMLDECGEAGARYAAALPLYRALDDRLGEANVYCGMADLEYYMENYTEADALYRQALDAYRAADIPFNIGHALQYLGHTALATGNIIQARAYYGEALELFTRIGSPAAADVQADLDNLSSL